MTIVGVRFEDIRPGHKVKIVDKWVRSSQGYYRHASLMNKYRSCVMTVDRVNLRDGVPQYLSLSDSGGINEGWSWFPEMIAGVVIEDPLDTDEEVLGWASSDICSLF